MIPLCKPPVPPQGNWLPANSRSLRGAGAATAALNIPAGKASPALPSRGRGAPGSHLSSEGRPPGDPRPLHGDSSPCSAQRPRLASLRCTRRRRPRSSFPAALGPRKGAGRQGTEERKGPAGSGGDGTGPGPWTARPTRCWTRRSTRCSWARASSGGPRPPSTPSAVSATPSPRRRAPPRPPLPPPSLPAPRVPSPCTGGTSLSAAPTPPASDPLSSDPFPPGGSGAGGSTCPAPRHLHQGFLPGSRRGFLLVKSRPFPAGLRGPPARRDEAFQLPWPPLLLTACFVPLQRPSPAPLSARLPRPAPASAPIFPPTSVFPTEMTIPGGQREGRRGRWMPAESSGREEVWARQAGEDELPVKIFMKRAWIA